MEVNSLRKPSAGWCPTGTLLTGKVVVGKVSAGFPPFFLPSFYVMMELSEKIVDV